ncbi:DUF2169 domain-containing protein [Labrys sp. LIt4]|uniref:DUF2169 family type VI secretion system accessory protein n=1 Tax=Labrys sp. LIt4 TaxID=2821355 RepID=UPI001AE0A87E|nr:DUF2169 domain-containing protein [Labrys sp. LIt4]MBP0583239.1 DUF2169 domain-containing protein [Labrys sp. LIt4]
MLGKNSTPFAAIAFEQMHRDGDNMAVVAVRGSYELSADGELNIGPSQAVVLADEYEGDPHTTPLLRVSDLIPFKPASDVTILGYAYSPKEQNCPFHFGLSIAGREYWLRCHGERTWEAVGRDWQALAQSTKDSMHQHAASSYIWKLSASVPLSRIPLDYAMAAGGEIVGAQRYLADPRNPRGAGILHPSFVLDNKNFPAPSIDSEEAPVTSPFEASEPQGTAPIPPWWAWRQRYAGTYDDTWKRERYPQLPKDFSYSFYQSGHPKLVWKEYLRGDETITLYRLTQSKERLTFVLPAMVPIARFLWRDDREVIARLNLDGVHIDMREGPPWRVDLTWRAWIAVCPLFFKVDLKLARLDHPLLHDLPIVGEFGLEDAPGRRMEEQYER